MRAVVQRASEARVEVEGRVVGSIGLGFVVLLGVARGDTEKDAEFIAAKIAGLRLFPRVGGADFDLNLAEVNGEVLLISQFTLLGDCRKGRRPNWGRAAAAFDALVMYDIAKKRLTLAGLRVREGRFGEHMHVSLVNDGPVTVIIDSRKTEAE